jgi:hypothetical protein
MAIRGLVGGSAPAHTKARWVPTAGAMAALLLLYAGWQLFRWPVGHRVLLGDAFFYPVGIAAIITSMGAARRCADRPRLRWAWRLLALASLAYLAGDVSQTVYELAGSKPYPSVGDAFYLFFYPLMLWGLLLFATGRRDVAERLRLVLDLAVVAIGGAVVVIYVVLGPTVVQSGSDGLQNAFSVAYPVGDMVLLVGLASVLLRRTALSSIHALRFMAVGLLFFVIADLVYGGRHASPRMSAAAIFREGRDAIASIGLAERREGLCVSTGTLVRR